jgi:hypothetical protein
MAAMTVEIDALLAHGRADEHLGEQGGVEAVKNTVTRGDHVTATAFNEGDKLLVTEAGGLVENAPGGAWVVDVAAGSFEVFQKDSDALCHALVLIGELCEKGPREQCTPSGIIEFTLLREETQKDGFAEESPAERLEG